MRQIREVKVDNNMYDSTYRTKVPFLNETKVKYFDVLLVARRKYLKRNTEFYGSDSDKQNHSLFFEVDSLVTGKGLK